MTTPTTCAARATTSSTASSGHGGIRRVVVTSSLAAIISEADIAELARRPMRRRGPRTRRGGPKAHTRARAGLLDGQGHRAAHVRGRRGGGAVGGMRSRRAPATTWARSCLPINKDGGPWQHLIERMVEGRCEVFQGTGPYRPWMTVDVRDDAACHIGLLESDKVANGERSFAMSTETRELRRHLRLDRPGVARAAPRPGSDRRRRRPSGGRSDRTSSVRSGAGFSCATTASGPRVPITFRPLDDSIHDCVESLIAVAGIIPPGDPD